MIDSAPARAPRVARADAGDVDREQAGRDVPGDGDAVVTQVQRARRRAIATHDDERTAATAGAVAA